MLLPLWLMFLLLLQAWRRSGKVVSLRIMLAWPFVLQFFVDLIYLAIYSMRILNVGWSISHQIWITFNFSQLTIFYLPFITPSAVLSRLRWMFIMLWGGILKYFSSFPAILWYTALFGQSFISLVIFPGDMVGRRWYRFLTEWKSFILS